MAHARAGASVGSPIGQHRRVGHQQIQQPGKRAEEGCLEYHSHVDNIDPSVFVFYEVWRSSEDLDRHLALPHLREFWESRMDYLTRDLDIRFVDMLSPYPR